MDLNKTNFTSETSKGVALVLFYSSASVVATRFWKALQNCGKPIFRVNIDIEKQLADDNNIRISPIVYYYKDGELINTYRFDELEKLLCMIKS